MADLGFLPDGHPDPRRRPRPAASGCCSRPPSTAASTGWSALPARPGHARGRLGADRRSTTMDHHVFRAAPSDKAADRRRDRRAPGAHAVLRAHQARRRPAGQAARQAAAPMRSRSTATSARASASARSTAFTRRTQPGCWWPPTSPPAASTSTTSTWSCTTTRRTTTRTTCTAPGAPPGPGRPARWCRSSRPTWPAILPACTLPRRSARG